MSTDLTHATSSEGIQIWEEEKAAKISLAEEVCQDLDLVLEKHAVPAQVGWLDVHGCRESFHCFNRVEGKLIVCHSDDEICEHSEYSLKELR